MYTIEFLDICFRATAGMGIFAGEENIAMILCNSIILCTWFMLRIINKECKYKYIFLLYWIPVQLNSNNCCTVLRFLNWALFSYFAELLAPDGKNEDILLMMVSIFVHVKQGSLLTALTFTVRTFLESLLKSKCLLFPFFFFSFFLYWYHVFVVYKLLFLWLYYWYYSEKMRHQASDWTQ